jgi:hypothetical protein
MQIKLRWLRTDYELHTANVMIKLKQPHYTPQGAWRERRYSSYSFSASALDGGEWSASRTGRALAPGKGTPVPIVQEAPRAGLDTEARGKIPSPLPGIEPRSPSRPARSQTLHWLSYPAHQWETFSMPNTTGMFTDTAVQELCMHKNLLCTLIAVISQKSGENSHQSPILTK